MTDVARREATAGSHIGSRTDDNAGTLRNPDRKPLEALKAAARAEADAAMTDVHSRGSRTTGSEADRSSQGSTRNRSRCRNDGCRSLPTRESRHAEETGSPDRKALEALKAATGAAAPDWNGSSKRMLRTSRQRARTVRPELEPSEGGKPGRTLSTNRTWTRGKQGARCAQIEADRVI